MTPAEATTLFRSLTALCGLDHRELADMLGRSPQTARHKLAGSNPVVGRDLDILADHWRRIAAGDDGLKGRSAEHARTIAWVRERAAGD